jgi:hypothetical protein
MVHEEQDTIMSFIRFTMSQSQRSQNRKIEVVGTPFGMQELDPCKRLTALKPEGSGPVEKTELNWLESVEEDVKRMGERNWRRE